MSHKSGLFGCAVLLASGVSMVAYSVDCCQETASWSGTCSGNSTTWCEEATTTGGDWKFSSGPRLARCTTATLPQGSSFVQADCNNPPTGYTRIGPPLYGNTCCFAPSQTSCTTNNRDFSIVPCSSLSCSSSEDPPGGED